MRRLLVAILVVTVSAAACGGGGQSTGGSGGNGAGGNATRGTVTLTVGDRTVTLENTFCEDTPALFAVGTGANSSDAGKPDGLTLLIDHAGKLQSAQGFWGNVPWALNTAATGTLNGHSGTFQGKDVVSSQQFTGTFTCP